MIDETVLMRLEALTIHPEKPMLVVDVDEVLVGLAGHLGAFAEQNGFTLRLTEYRLDGALHRADGTQASPKEFRGLFKQFFETQTLHQRVYPDAAETLRAVSERVQVVILTNVPDYAEDARVENLRGHGIDYPLVVNSGGKGRALSWLAARTQGKVAFIDDSPTQIGSAAKHAPEVVRLHFVGDENLRRILGSLEDANHAPQDWREIAGILDGVFRRASSEIAQDGLSKRQKRES